MGDEGYKSYTRKTIYPIYPSLSFVTNCNYGKHSLPGNPIHLKYGTKYKNAFCFVCMGIRLEKVGSPYIERQNINIIMHSTFLLFLLYRGMQREIRGIAVVVKENRS